MAHGSIFFFGGDIVSPLIGDNLAIALKNGFPVHSLFKISIYDISLLQWQQKNQ